MGASERRKGAGGERELFRLLKDELGVSVVRNLNQTRNGGADGEGLEGVALEVKRAKQARIGPWIAQTVEQAERAGAEPVLAYRVDRQSWRFVVRLGLLCGDFENSREWAVLSLAGFCEIYRNWRAGQCQKCSQVT